MTKPDYEVATVYSTFWGQSQSEVLRKIADYLDDMPKIQLAAEDFNIQIIWSQRGVRRARKDAPNWHFEGSINTYWTKHLVDNIKNEVLGNEERIP